MTTHTDRVFHTIGELAAHYGVSRSTVKRRIKDGGLRIYRFGPRSIRIKLSDAEKAFRSKA